MAFSFKPASSFIERSGLFISLTGGTSSGKTFSSLRLARGIAGLAGKIAVLDTEAGRTLHLKQEFDFDVDIMDPPFRPERFAEAAKSAEDAKYDCLVIDSFSMEWVGLGGVLDWQANELMRMAGDDFKKQERMKMVSWIKPKVSHKSMVYSLLQRRIPIIFSIRGEESVKPGENGEKPTKIFKPVCNSAFPYEVTVSFRLETERKGYIDLSDPKSFKLEGAHHAIFKPGDRIGEEHGRALAEWARGGMAGVAKVELTDELWAAATAAAAEGRVGFGHWWKDLPRPDRAALHPRLEELKALCDAPADQDETGEIDNAA